MMHCITLEKSCQLLQIVGVELMFEDADELRREGRARGKVLFVVVVAGRLGFEEKDGDFPGGRVVGPVRRAHCLRNR